MKNVTRLVVMLAVVVGCLATVRAQGDAESREGGLDDAALIDKVSRSVVMVEHTFRYDRGEAPEPEPAGMAYRGAEGDMDGDWASLISQERAEERMGFVIAPDLVLTVDPLVHGRFVERIEVRDGDRRIGAVPEAYAVNENAVLLRLDEPLRNAEPLEFDAEAAGPLKAIAGRQGNSRWWLMANGVDGSTMIGMGDGAARYHVVPWPSLIVDGEGTAVGACFDGGLEVDGSWKGSPAGWEWVSAAKMAALLKDVGARADAVLPRVELRFRSPRQTAASRWQQGEEEFTEWNGTGVLLGERVLVLAQLAPKVTARLETALVHLPDGRAVPAEFVGSLRRFGAMVVELDGASGVGSAVLSPEGLREYEDELLVRSQVRVLGENRTSYAWQARLARMMTGYRGRVYGQFGDVSAAGTSTGAGSDGPMSFLFDTEGRLVALPLIVRKRVTDADWSGYSRGDYQPTVLGAADLAEILAGDDAFDPDNRPLSEAEENRLAWLGVELQAMDPDLARFNNVADQTSGGMTGGIVTYVYAGSPAAKAGLEVGDILLRLHIDGQPRPLDVQVNPYDMGWGAQYLEVLEQIDPSVYDRVPPPWGSAETALTRALTDVGFGTKFRADVVRNGEMLEPEFAVEEGPAHFGAAARFKSAGLGLTVRDLTYEARRFMQRAADEAGVVVAKVEAGERAAVAGVKPFELIVAVNDEPVHNVEEFEAAIAGGGELRLSVMRMHLGRIVRVTLPEGEAEEATE
ncbi:MAG: PDZ domain-containing protein [Phycisphaerales bacterium JB054]